MHFEGYFNIKKNNQETFNKKLSWFLDIKSINYKKINKITEIKFANILIKNFNQINNKQQKKKIVIKSKKINFSKINFKKINKKQLIKIINTAKKLKLNNYFKHFVFQGSTASQDGIKGWSDIDIFAVTHDTIFKDKNKLIELRKKLKKFYKEVINFCKFQHHGIIVYTEKDLKNYLNGYLPTQALIKNFSIFKNDKITFFKTKTKKINLSQKIIINRINFLKKTLKIGEFNHHLRTNKIPKIPFKKDQPFMFELFYQISTTLNIPILYLDAIGQSSHKKHSFRKFYKLIKNKNVENFLKKHEKIRKNWQKYNQKNYIINKNLIKILGDFYMEDTLNIYKILLKKLKIPRKSI